MSKQKWYRWIVGTAFVIVLLTVACLSAEFHFRAPRNPGATVVMQGEFAVLVRDGWKKLPDGTKVGVPILHRLEDDEFDFGVMDPLSDGRHSFPVRNEGHGNLELEVASTTCQCTVAELARKVVPPGEQTTIDLEWKTGYLRDFLHSTSITTNDPVKPRLELRVRGRVRQIAAAEPAELGVGVVEPEKTGTARVLVFSHLWPAMEVLEAKASRPDYVVRTEPADVSGQEYASQDVKCGVWVSVQVPGGGPPGLHQERVTLRVVSAAGEEPRTVEIPLLTTMARRLATYGQGIDETGQIDVGIVPQHLGKKLTLLVKIRDEDRDLHLREIKVEPNFVNVTLTPVTSSETKGLYHLVVDVPADSSECNRLQADERGSIRLLTDHPRIPEQVYSLRIAVRKEL